MDNIKRIIFAILAFVGMASLHSCNDDSIIADADNQTEEQTHTVTLKLSGGLQDFDSSRAEDFEWKDGDKIYLYFNPTVKGEAVYDAACDAWSLTYTGELSQGVSAKCEAYYFEGAGMHRLETGKEWIDLFHTTAIFADKKSTYICEDEIVTVYAILSPQTGRIRFRGEPGTVFTVSGINYYEEFCMYKNYNYKNDLYSRSGEITDSIGADGYSPYFYGYLSDESTKEITISQFDGKYTKSLSDNALTAGHSGCLTLPNADSHSGWIYDKNTKSIFVNGVTFRMKLVEAGTFTMGATEEQTGAYDNEKPAHQVTLTKDYYLGETEVTQALWYAVMGQSPTSDGDKWTAEKGLGDNYPAYYLSWNDCQEFITKLNQITGLTFRLPTEAEWEYAARGGNKATTQTLYSGSNTIGDVAWYGSSSTHAVAGKAANALGLYDMSGNVWEWCNDWFNYSYYSNSPQTDPVGYASGANRILRGGSCSKAHEDCRVARRYYASPTNIDSSYGMRLALGDPFPEPEPEPEPEEIQTVTANGVTFKMKFVEAGTFTMGATSEQTGAFDQEKPAHQVTITKDYYIGETEVTQALWYAVMGRKPVSDGNCQWLNTRGLGDNYPAYYISWNDCQEFITKLNQLTGLRFRLPTEAEWEYAARGGSKATTQTLYSGSNTIGDVAWYDGNSSLSTHEVAQKSANALGLYDMSGNVSEWCNDWYGSSYYSSSPQTDPTGPTSGSYRVLRGGSWSYYATNCRVANRLNHSVSFRYNYNGMRLAL